MKVLKSQDILALGFMTFALFVGAGNIIFPPIVGLQSGPHVWMAALGFLITAVGLPVVTVIALAKVGGGMDALSSPIGKIAGGLLAAAAYLAVGPLFATPRTATVSFEVGLAPLTGESPLALFLYSSVYFLLVFFISLYPGRLLDTVGRFLAPLKIIALAVLGIVGSFVAGFLGAQRAREALEHRLHDVVRTLSVAELDVEIEPGVVRERVQEVLGQPAVGVEPGAQGVAVAVIAHAAEQGHPQQAGDQQGEQRGKDHIRQEMSPR